MKVEGWCRLILIFSKQRLVIKPSVALEIEFRSFVEFGVDYRIKRQLEDERLEKLDRDEI